MTALTDISQMTSKTISPPQDMISINLKTL